VEVELPEGLGHFGGAVRGRQRAGGVRQDVQLVGVMSSPCRGAARHGQRAAHNRKWAELQWLCVYARLETLTLAWLRPHGSISMISLRQVADNVGLLEA
jgi:hypothetical protein